MKICRYISIAALILSAVACGGPRSGDSCDNSREEDKTAVAESDEQGGEAGIPVDNAVIRRLAKLAGRGEAQVWVHTDDSRDSLEVWRAVRELGRYAEGERKYFPDTELRKAMSEVAFELGYVWSHGCWEEDETNPGEVFLFELLDEAARITPKADFIADFCSEDGNIGILNYHEWSPNPMLSFLIYRSGDGFRKQLIGRKGYVRIDKIFFMGEHGGDPYYLLSNNTTPLFFCQYLYRLHKGRAELVCDNEGFPTLDCDKDEDLGYGYLGTEIIFNPRTLIWCYATRDGEYYHKVGGSPELRLDFDGPRSRFILERP